MATSRKPLFDDAEPTATDAKPATETPEDPPLAAPPEADVVAARALMVGALLERAKLESAPSESHFAALRTWVDDQGLFTNLGPDGLQLFESKLGSWSDEDVEAVDWTSEELQLLLWAMQQADYPRVDERADGAKLLKKLPVLGEVDAFLEGATLRSLDELEVHRALAEAVLEAIRAEVYARSVQEDPSSIEGDEDLQELLASVEAEGFDRKAAAEKGAANEAILGLRHWSRSLLTELFGPESPHKAHRIDSAQLVGLDEPTLATWLGIAHSRSEAMAWLLEGDEYET
jgi:hypothetical protein